MWCNIYGTKQLAPVRTAACLPVCSWICVSLWIFAPSFRKEDECLSATVMCTQSADGEGQAGPLEVTQNGDRLTGGLKPTWKKI
jgi:hypothetical protein